MSVQWLLLLGPALVCLLAIALLRGTSLAKDLADEPNHRSLHVAPRPRIGGLGLLAGAMPFIAWAADPVIAALAAIAAALAVVSFLDDLRSLPIQVRLPAHAVAAGIAMLAIANPAAPLGAFAAVIFGIAIVWATNLYNFMDGADGLAGGMAIAGFAAYAFAAGEAGMGALAWASVALASAAAGFLVHNFPPARVFMGDAGSVPLGFLAGAFGVHGIAAGAWPWWFPPLAFAPFVLDASVTILRRLARGERIWVAHREHFYQRLVLSGWSPRAFACGAYLLMAACALAALWALRAEGAGAYAIIAATAGFHFLLFVAIERRHRAAAKR